ncbi:hypothetical protein [Alienimonas sp. DA493]|uniref:hypothetical protein n=1 Tax=Alienimonas sp. DA493 TaxID=3373605 RepID=UPI003753FD32
MFTHFDAVLGATVLGQTQSADYAPGGQPISVYFSDGTDPATHYGGPADPRVTIEATDLAAVFGNAAVLTDGWCVEGGTVSVPYANRGKCGAFESGNVHRSLNGTDALVLVRSVGWSEGGGGALATASLEVLFLSSDGTTVPVALSAAGALPDGRKNAAVYGPGPVYVGGTLAANLVPEVTGVACSPGITTEPKTFGYNWPVARPFAQRAPTVELTFESLAAAQTFTNGSAFGSFTSFACYFRKRSGAGFVADNVAEHIKVTFAAGLTQGGGIRSRAGANGDASVTVHGLTMVGVAGVTIP